MTNQEEVRTFAGDNACFEDWVNQDGSLRQTNALIGIQTLEGVMLAMPNDWIIKGIKGEFYPCKPDIFEGSYEPAQEPKAETEP